MATREARSNEANVFKVCTEYGACTTYLATESTVPCCLTLTAFPYTPDGFKFATPFWLNYLLKSIHQVLTSSNRSGGWEEEVLHVTGCEIVCGENS